MEQQTGWDRRSWRIGLASGGVCVLLYVFGMSLSPPLSHQSAGTAQSRTAGQGDAIMTVATLVANFLLPAVLCAFARRRFLLWGLLPQGMLAASALAAHFLQHDFGPIRRDMVLIPAYVAFSLLFITGPISLLRSLRARSRRRRAAAAAEYERQRAAASTQQDGVWPPPPAY